MGTLSMIAAGFVLCVTGWPPTAAAQGMPNAVGTQPVSTGSAAAPVVAEQADLLLRHMSEYVGSAAQFTYHARKMRKKPTKPLTTATMPAAARSIPGAGHTFTEIHLSDST